MAITVTLSTLRTDVQALMDDTAGVLYTDTLVAIALNKSLRHLRHLFMTWEAVPYAAKDTISVVADTVEYAIDKEIRIFEKVTVLGSDSKERQLEVVDFTDVERLQDQGSSDTIGPRYFYRKANFIGFLPTPQSAHTAYVYSSKEPDNLSADGDAITMPPWVENVVVFKACSYCASAKGDMKAKQLYENDYKEAKVEMEFTMQRWQRQETVGIRPLWDLDWDVALSV